MTRQLKIFTGGLVVACAGSVFAWAALTAIPDIPLEVKYRYMQHAFLNAEIQRQLNASLTPQQRVMYDKLSDLATELQEDNATMSEKCGPKFVLDKDKGTNEPSCKPKDARSTEHAGGK